jgi:PAS domain S-box-containing protein
MSVISGGPRPVLGGFMLEITYRRETEESLRESKFLIEQIASASPVIVYVFDLQSRQLIYLNGRVAEILGYSKEELAMMDPFFIVALSHPSEKEEHAAHFTRLQRIGPDDIEQREFRLRSASGAWVWLSSRETAFKYDKESGALEIVGTASDITQRREALDELQANESLFRKLAETTKVIPFEVDLLSGRFTYVGPQAEQLLGYPISLWSQPGFWSSLVPPEYLQAAHLLTPAALELEGDFQAEFPLRTADGRHVWIRQILNRAVGEGQRRQARGFLFDISEAKEVEQERERSRLLLRELAARSQGVREQERINLARELHDEMGQSLTLLRLDIAWVNNRLAKLASKARAVEPIQAKLHSMEQVLHETLQTVRRIISSLRPPVLDELGLADAIQWQAMEFARRVGIRCEVVAEAVDPLSDEIATCVFRIFQEILTNVARHAQATRVNVKLERTNRQLCLCVSDNGRGFTQSESAHGKSFGLLGMRERAWALGGTVEIDAAPGQGTTVSLELPIPIEAPKPEQATAL